MLLDIKAVLRVICISDGIILRARGGRYDNKAQEERGREMEARKA